MALNKVFQSAQLVPRYHTIGRCNNYVVLQSISCSPKCEIVGKILLDHPLSYALTATTDVTVVYLQQFWRIESDELIKSSVENLVPIPSESEVTSDDESECDMPVCDDFTTFSNPLFDSNHNFNSSDDESLSDDEEIISPNIDPHYFNADVKLLISIDSSGKLRKPNLSRMEDNRFVEELLYDNSSLRPPEELNLEIADTILESLSLHLLSSLRIVTLIWRRSTYFLLQMTRCHRALRMTIMTRKGIFVFLKNCLIMIPFPFQNKYHLHLIILNVHSYLLSPPKPLDVEFCFDFEPDTGVVTTKVVKGISEHYVLMPNIFPPSHP
ncbi:hypothetical protein Tco_0795023 [Tanacetum coccineum]